MQPCIFTLKNGFTGVRERVCHFFILLSKLGSQGVAKILNIPVPQQTVATPVASGVRKNSATLYLYPQKRVRSDSQRFANGCVTFSFYPQNHYMALQKPLIISIVTNTSMEPLSRIDPDSKNTVLSLSSRFTSEKIIKEANMCWNVKGIAE